MKIIGVAKEVKAIRAKVKNIYDESRIVFCPRADGSGEKILKLHFNPAPYKGFKRFKDLFTVEAGPFILLSNFSTSLTADALGVDSFSKEFGINLQANQHLNIIFTPANGQSYAFINGIEIILVPPGLYYFHGGDVNGVSVTSLGCEKRLITEKQTILPGEYLWMWDSGLHSDDERAQTRGNAIATVAITILALVNITIHMLVQIGEATSAEEKNMPSARAERLCRRFSLAEIQLATRSFVDAHLIGRGGFGKVYKGVIDNGRETVAIRRLKSNSKQGHKEMILIYEYVACGTLADHLYKLARNNDNSSSLMWKQRLNICIGAGRWLDYLHTGHSLILRDVKASNILVDENFTSKVSDFGLAKHENRSKLQSHVSTNVKGTFGYLDPHYLTTRKLTRKSDTYSFGVVLLEVLCGRPALDTDVAEDEQILAKWARENINTGKIGEIVASNLRDEISKDSLKEFVEIAEKCFHEEPKKRPTMAQVVLQLEFALEQQESTKSLVPNRITSHLNDDLRPCNNETNLPVSNGQLRMASTDVLNFATPTFVDNKVFTAEPLRRKDKPSRLWPWDAFWKRVKTSTKNELLLLGEKILRPHFNPAPYKGFKRFKDLFTVEADLFILLSNFSASLTVDALGVDSFSKEFSDDTSDIFVMWEMVNNRKANNITWRVSVDVGFKYLVRLHFLKLGFKMAETAGLMFKIYINEMIANTNYVGTVSKGDEDNSIPWFQDYIVMMKGRKQEGKRDLLIHLQSNDEFIDGYGPLKGFEIMKLSNPENSLASPHPLPSPNDSSHGTIQNLRQVIGHRNAVATVAITILAFAEIQLANRSFSDAHLIGRGGFVKVYKGVIDNGRETVAIKRLKSNSKQGAREFLTEIETLTELRRVNLVSLIGYCNKHKEMILIYEYVACGTLADHLYKLARNNDNSSSLTWKQRLNISIGAGRGLDYLHTGHSLIHRDVKASNIRWMKISLLKFQILAWPNTKTEASYKAMKSDTYSFGVVLLEILCGRPALDTRVAEDEHVLAKCRIDVPANPVDEFKDITDNFGPKSFIGEGLYGKVYHGVLRNERAASIRKLDSSTKPDHKFLAQVSKISNVKHENVVELLGYCVNGGLRVLAYELFRLELIDDGEVSKTHNQVRFCQRVKIAFGAAKGLEYLHEKAQPPSIHGDFQSSNVMISDDDVAKITDFELSNQAFYTETRLDSYRVLVTFGYQCPEYAMTGQISLKGDVYSFGVVLLELLTGLKPVDHTRPRGQQSLVTWTERRKPSKGSCKDSWDTLVVSVSNSAPNGDLTLQVVKDCLLNEESRRKEQAFSTEQNALVTKNSDRRGRNKSRGPQHQRDKSRGKSKFKGDFKCHYCGGPNLYERDCRKKKRDQKNGNNENKKDDKDTTTVATDGDVVIICDDACVSSSCQETDWIIDSGASYHITPHRDMFTSYTSGNFGRVRMANHGVTEVIGMGNINLETDTGCRLILRDVRHIPDIRLNIISTGKLDDDGYVSNFGEGKWKLTKGSLITAKSKKKNSLYLMQAKLSNGESEKRESSHEVPDDLDPVPSHTTRDHGGDVQGEPNDTIDDEPVDDQLDKVHTDDNGADMLTKSLPREKPEVCKSESGLVVPPT
ncbi:hypothetical protein BUALT_Bualt02G0059900 [Buddleja alternifolia]|uniref:Protein kinase domain-containing protein n=1 Tax=Buddleja alternifolia TaxID=168488 RepID=A0AAV6Y4J1_9LAMI|nr:hypothetical protein BUALT_Bualt02G0059900 [Buddleja alternifolia]